MILRILILAFFVFLAGFSHAEGGIVLDNPESAFAKFFPLVTPTAAVKLELTLEQRQELVQMLEPYRDRSWKFLKQNSFLLYAASERGWMLLVDEIGKHRPITFAVAVSSEANLLGLRVLVYREAYGQGITAESFMHQYKGKGWRDGLAIPKDLDAVSGAIFSSFATSRAARKALAVLRLTGKIRE